MLPFYQRLNSFSNTRYVLAILAPVCCLLGIQEETTKHGSAHVFKLKGKPFSDMTNAKEAMSVRRLAAHLLFKLHNLGCKLLVSSNLAQTKELATWLFHREQTIAAQFNFACIAVSSTDTLQLIDFPSGMNEALKNVVEKNWPQDIQKTKPIGESMEIKLCGNPWMDYTGPSPENIQSKTLIKALINELDSRQWILYGSSNLRGTADTLFFKYDPGAVADESRKAGFVISLNKKNRLRCIDTPEDAKLCVKNMITQYWSRGIMEEKEKENAYQFTLGGNPFWATTGDMAVDSRLLMCKIFEKLWSIGWKVHTAIELSRKYKDKSIITFQRTAPRHVPILCLSLNWTNRVRVINGPQTIVNAVSSEVKKLWPVGLKSEGEFGSSYEIKMLGKPWSSGGHDGAHGRVLLLHLLKLLGSFGWFLIISTDISAQWLEQDTGPDYPIDVHSWWFMQIGQPVAAPPKDFASAPPAFMPTQFGMQGQ